MDNLRTRNRWLCESESSLAVYKCVGVSYAYLVMSFGEFHKFECHKILKSWLDVRERKLLCRYCLLSYIGRTFDPPTQVTIKENYYYGCNYLSSWELCNSYIWKCYCPVMVPF